MKRRISFPFIAALAGTVLLAGWGVIYAMPALAQQNAAPAAVPSGGGLDERVLRLEERIKDLQSVIGTLQSFIRDGGASPAQSDIPPAGGQAEITGGGGPSEVSIRVLALETQIRALTGQMKQISERLDQVPAGGSAQSFSPAQQPLDQTRAPLPQGQQLGGATVNPLAPAPPPRPANLGPAQAPQFGTTASPPQPANPFDPVLQSTPAPAQAVPLQPLAGLPSEGEGPRAMYDASYQNILRSDFAAAENGFRSFITTYPADQLIGNAYYWLGRSHFVRKQFEPAAKAFLAGYKKNKKSAIAPDSLLHLGLSLVQLGEKGAACSTLEAVSKQFPEASDKLKQDAAAAIKRARC